MVCIFQYFRQSWTNQLAVFFFYLLSISSYDMKSVSVFVPVTRCDFLFSVRRYNLSSRSWVTLDPSVNTVTPRYGHSLALHEVTSGEHLNHH